MSDLMSHYVSMLCEVSSEVCRLLSLRATSTRVRDPRLLDESVRMLQCAAPLDGFNVHEFASKFAEEVCSIPEGDSMVALPTSNLEPCMIVRTPCVTFRARVTFLPPTGTVVIVEWAVGKR